MISDDKDLLIKSLKKKPYLVDVRTPAEFKGGSAKGAVNIPVDEVPDRLTEFENKDDIIVFCRSGNRSNKAKKFLKKKGVDRVLNGGTWQNINKLVHQGSQKQ